MYFLRPYKIISLCFILTLLVTPGLSYAEDVGFDDILSGFDEVSSGEDLGDELDGFDQDEHLDTEFVQKEVTSLPPWLKFSGGLSLATAFNFSHDTPQSGQTDHRDLSKLKTSANLIADIASAYSWQGRMEIKGFYDSIYDLKGREDYTSQVLDEYVKELEIGELWAQGSLGANLDLKLGRQIVVWGKSDNIRVTDVLNPLDNREPGLVDIRDLRLPVAMSKIDYYSGKWNLSTIILHENRFNKNPVYGNDFYGGSAPAPSEDEPNFAMQNQEYALAINGIFNGWDLSFYGAHLFDDTSHLSQTASGLRQQHSRINMAGVAINVVQGSWLLKAETAWLDGLEYSIDVGKKSRFDLLVGTEYTGFAETVISLELANRHIMAYDDRLKAAPAYIPEDEAQLVLRVSRDFLHDTLTVTGLISAFILSDNDGAFERLTAEYELSQDWQLTTGLIFYQNGSKAAFDDIGDNDRFFCDLRYSF